ncbi:zinc finger BED domain-containing protein 4-like isoform X2 [Linepithema humile]|uniref:zinc finger BED domain-containing protein 4-like isoform X2 n=1 Tax=Linepithema humile TaxID=83485 RepID=UPI00351EAF3E
MLKSSNNLILSIAINCDQLRSIAIIRASVQTLFITNVVEVMDEEASQSSEKECKMPWPAYAEIFELQKNLGNKKNWAFLCKICIGKKIIHASKTSTENLRKHINAKHSHLLKNIDKTKVKLSNKRQNEDSLNNIGPNKCQILERWSSGNSAVTQKALDKAILRFIIEDIQPLSIVDSLAFVNLLRIGLPSQIRIMCRKTLREKICETYFKIKTALEKKLTEIEIVATTADLWSKAKRSYLEITIHWVNPETLERESAALACRRMKGKHTYDVLARAINSVFLEYHIQNKVCCTTTDNGSNFIKAFRFEKDDDETLTTVEFNDLSDLLIMDDVEDMDTESLLILPPHHRCVSHTLNLVAVKDSEKAIDSNVLYKKLYRLTFAKLTKLWNKQNQSTQVADKIKEICGVYLKTPVITRWNSTFDSILQLVTLLKNDSEKINKCLDYCNLQRLTENEIKFIEEYCQAMKPLAQALDIL